MVQRRPQLGTHPRRRGPRGRNFDPAKITLHIGGLPVFANGALASGCNEAATHAAMLAREYTIALDLGTGPGRASFLTCDLTHEYVSINADYST